MPRANTSLKRLVGFMAVQSSSRNPLEVASIAHKSGLSDPTVRRLLKEHSDIFAQVPNVYPFAYFYVPSPKGEAILANATAQFASGVSDRTNGSFVQTSDVYTMPTPVAERDPLLDQTKAVGLNALVDKIAETWTRKPPYNNTNVEELTNNVRVIKAITELIDERIKELTK